MDFLALYTKLKLVISTFMNQMLFCCQLFLTNDISAFVLAYLVIPHNAMKTWEQPFSRVQAMCVKCDLNGFTQFDTLLTFLFALPKPPPSPPSPGLTDTHSEFTLTPAEHQASLTLAFLKTECSFVTSITKIIMAGHATSSALASGISNEHCADTM